MSQRKTKSRIIGIILCAGEGTRLKNYIKNSPKPLVTLERLNNKTILHDTIKKLNSLNFDFVIVIIGHLKNQLKNFIKKLKPSFKDFIHIHDSKSDYKKGPLFSFLSLFKDKKFLLKEDRLILLPGDTIFDKKLLEEVLNQQVELLPCVLYFRELSINQLQITHPRELSIIETDNLGDQMVVRKIVQKKINENIVPMIKQLIPIISLNFEFIEKIRALTKDPKINTISAVINRAILNKLPVIAYEIPSNYNFYDIDTVEDVIYFNKS